MSEICVDVAIPPSCLPPNITFKRKVLKWEGRLYPDDAVHAGFDYFTLTLGPLPSFVVSQLPGHFQQENWHCISVSINDDALPYGLSSLADIYGEKRSFHKLLNTLLKHTDKWILMFSADCEASEKVEQGDLRQAFQKINEFITSKRGFILYSDPEHQQAVTAGPASFAGLT